MRITKTDTAEKLVVFFSKLSSTINFNLSILNWILVPIKLILFIISSLITRIVEPYRFGKETPEVDKAAMQTKQREFKTALFAKFQYRDFITCELRGTEPDGKNHYIGDWCLWNGVFIGMLAHTYKSDPSSLNKKNLIYYVQQYTDNWILDNGYVVRGWTWEKAGTRKYLYKLTMDQMSGLVYGLSQVPTIILKVHCADKICKLADYMLDNNFRFFDPGGDGTAGAKGCTYHRDFRFGILSSATSITIAMSVMLLAYNVSGDKKYYKKYRHFVYCGANLLTLIPSATAFDLVHGFIQNISLLSMVSYYTLRKNFLTKTGIKWLYFIINRVYNPWWAFLCHYTTGVVSERDLQINLYMLNSMDHSNTKDYIVHDPDKLLFLNKTEAKLRKYFWIFGNEYYITPPDYRFKAGDCFMLQSIWRANKKHRSPKFGQKSTIVRSNREYNMMCYLAPYHVYKLIEEKK